MRKISVEASQKSEILIGKGLLESAGTLAAEHLPKSRFLIITDRNVGRLYAGTVSASFKKAGVETELYEFPGGEDEKSAKRLVDILEYAAHKQFTRRDGFVALGGGIVGDIGGLAASLYLRGVPYVQIPTTFLAAVDSSVGGKTAVNLSSGKNLCGTFWQPALVLCDVSALATLPPDIFAAGAAEALKYGVLFDESLFASMESGLSRDAVPEAIVARCIELKRDVVMNDEFDRGARQLLNFGHTAGHAIEKLSAYEISHGRAVAMGMRIMTRAAERLSLCGEPFSDRLETALAKNGLSEKCPFSSKVLAQAALSDKKRRGGQVTVVLPEKLGSCVLHKIAIDELPALFKAGLSD
jgi:3-dehydroquinate synthase